MYLIGEITYWEPCAEMLVLETQNELGHFSYIELQNFNQLNADSDKDVCASMVLVMGFSVDFFF